MSDPIGPDKGVARDFVDHPPASSLTVSGQPDITAQVKSFVKEAIIESPEGVARLYSQLSPEVAAAASKIVQQVAENPTGTASAVAEFVAAFGLENPSQIAESLEPLLKGMELSELANPELSSTVQIPTPEIDPNILWPRPVPPMGAPGSTTPPTSAIKQLLLSGKGITLASLLAAGLLGTGLVWKFSGGDSSDIVGTWKADGQTLTITDTAGVLGGTVSFQEVKCDNDTGQACDQDHPLPPETWPLTSVAVEGHNVSITFDYSHPNAMEGYQHRMVTIQGHVSDDKLTIKGGGVLRKVP